MGKLLIEPNGKLAEPRQLQTWKLDRRMSGRIMLEIAPPRLGAGKDALESRVDRVKHALRGVNGINYLLVPEIINDEGNGMPKGMNVDTRIFGAELSETTGIESIVNNGLVAYRSREGLAAWILETVNTYQMRKAVLVGRSTDSKYCIGPQIIEANRHALEIADSGGFELNVGNILIPEREGESARAFSKTKSGCSFFTSQIIFKPDRAKGIVCGYANNCRRGNVGSGVVFLSFAPAKTQDDIDFFKWLGCDIPREVEIRLKKSQDMGKESIKFAKESLSGILEFVKKKGVPVQIGVNIEPVFIRNLDLAIKMANGLARIINRHYSIGKKHN